MKMKTLEDIKQVLIGQKSFLSQKYEVKEIWFFGSYVKGKQKGNSDLDILVEQGPFKQG
jgi:predicted nucleotidyltransferase